MTSIEYKWQVSRFSHVIYLIMILMFSVLVVLMPIIKVNINITSNGLIKSTIEKVEIVIPISGKIVAIDLKDNQSIRQGEILLKIDSSLPRQKDNSIQSRVNTVTYLLQDLAIITYQKENNRFSFKTPQYQAVYTQFLQDVQNLENTNQRAETIFKRYEKLYNEKVITEAEFEKYSFELKQANARKQLLIQKYQTQWQTEANQYREELRQLQSQSGEIKEQQKLYILKAPINGSLQNLSGLQAGAYVFANQKIGEISPDTKLTAYCYIKPSNIGLIRKGQEVRLNIDAFNYNQWGFVTGRVLDISDDIIVSNQQPVFKVKCSLDQEFLQLKNGYKGNLKKGMTFNARFMVTERTLYQLLYDKVDDWVNPNLAANK